MLLSAAHLHPAFQHRCRQAGQNLPSFQKNRLQRLVPCSSTARNSCFVHDLSNSLTPYERARRWQHQLVQEVLAASHTAEPSGHSGHALLVQHPPVYTLGAGSSVQHINFDLQHPPHPLIRTERGGEVTYHGPGQLVLYPIINLRLFRTDLHWYLRSLEEVIIRALEMVSGIQGTRIDGMTGVWVNEQKIAAIGVRAKSWVTYHGLALNVAMDLQPFQAITPCGLQGRTTTSVQLMQAQHSDRPAMLIQEYAVALLEAFADVFDVHMEPATSGVGRTVLPESRPSLNQGASAGSSTTSPT